jgi:hypothetical protein
VLLPVGTWALLNMPALVAALRGGVAPRGTSWRHGMTDHVAALLSRLEPYRLREYGHDRWRACCPAHGGNNPTALSVGIGDGGTVLLRCWHGCTVEQVVGALRLDLHDLFPPKPEPGGGRGPIKRRRMLTDREALDLLHDEMYLCIAVEYRLARDEPLDEPTRERLLQGAARVVMLRDEVRA